MIFVKIAHSEPNVTDMVNYLDHIAMLISQGWTKGDGWELIKTNEKQTDDSDNQTEESKEPMEEISEDAEYLEE